MGVRCWNTGCWLLSCAEKTLHSGEVDTFIALQYLFGFQLLKMATEWMKASKRQLLTLAIGWAHVFTSPTEQLYICDLIISLLPAAPGNFSTINPASIIALRTSALLQ